MIYLRKLEVSDLDRTWVWINTPEIFMIMGVNSPISKTAQRRWFDQLDVATDKIVFAVCMNDDDTHIGNVSLDTIDTRHRNARLSIFLADPKMRGKGIGSRAMKLLLEYGFNHLNLHRMYAKTDADREDVTNYYLRLGFQVEGKLREHEYRGGQYRDKNLVAILRSDWESIQTTERGDEKLAEFAHRETKRNDA